MYSQKLILLHRKQQCRSFSWQIFVDMQKILVWQCSQGVFLPYCSIGVFFNIPRLFSRALFHLTSGDFHHFKSFLRVLLFIIPSYFRYFAFQSVRTWKMNVLKRYENKCKLKITFNFTKWQDSHIWKKNISKLIWLFIPVYLNIPESWVSVSPPSETGRSQTQQPC